MYIGSLSAENPKILGSGPHSLGFQLSCLPLIFGNIYIWHDPFINLKASRHIVSVWCWHMPVHLEAFRWKVAEKCMTQRWVIKLRKSNPWKNKYGQYTCPPLWFSRIWLIIAPKKWNIFRYGNFSWGSKRKNSRSSPARRFPDPWAVHPPPPAECSDPIPSLNFFASQHTIIQRRSFSCMKTWNESPTWQAKREVGVRHGAKSNKSFQQGNHQHLG